MGEHHQDNLTLSAGIARQSTFRRPFILGVATVAVFLASLFGTLFCAGDDPPPTSLNPGVIVTPPTPRPSTVVPRPKVCPSHPPHKTTPPPEPPAREPAPAPAKVPAPTVTRTRTVTPATHAPSPSPSRKCVVNLLGVCV